MKKFQPGSSVFLLVLTFSFYVSWATLSSPGSGELIRCLQSNSNNVTTISQLIFTPVNSSFQPIWQVAVQNTRFLKPSTPKPSVIVTPVEETLIQTSLYCAKKHGYELRIRSGGHDYEGLSYTADVPFVMLDFTNMRSIDHFNTQREDFDRFVKRMEMDSTDHLNKFKVGSVPTLYYIPDFISDSDQKLLLNHRGFFFLDLHSSSFEMEVSEKPEIATLGYAIAVYLLSS
ncbi:hypothetical protein L2E82_35637 [Cichorium intybus]|uniref:Uncharacterized protein n=1 Tax=Cichorium intybus TaxID=13427 RepID=A0ACB9BPB3_CICIN|nr:hypothetical protein L2E82_35637 [Cichorium intybus]